jgi:hypothetical protein
MVIRFRFVSSGAQPLLRTDPISPSAALPEQELGKPAVSVAVLSGLFVEIRATPSVS